MPKVQLVKFRFRKNGQNKWLNWSKELKRRKKEAVATLRDEGVHSEACFLSKDGKFVFYFMEAGDIKKVQKIFDKSPHLIDAQHKQKLVSCLKFLEVLTPLFHFQNR